MQRTALTEILSDLTGQDAPRPIPPDIEVFGQAVPGLGFSQLNELLLLVGYDRVDPGFFQYLATGLTEYESGTAINDLMSLRAGVDRFRRMALLLFGNVKFAFKTLSKDADVLREWLAVVEPRPEASFHDRHAPIRAIQRIPGEDTYFLGYLVQKEIDDRLKTDSTDPLALRDQQKRTSVVEVGIRNHEAYLASDHLDVYVATSMRERHEYLLVHQLTQKIFGSSRLSKLKLRWFDPTQAYCKDRIDKGLAEALMLKRAKCTLYFVQESDTLGKDSELASTLAQGKPVIAFVPDPSPQDVEALLEDLKRSYPGLDESRIILEQLRLCDASMAWRDAEVQMWIGNPGAIDPVAAKARLYRAVKEHYDRRAHTLKEAHPLGVQVHLSTGVANGVLVVRRIDQCADLIGQVLTNTVEFTLDEMIDEGRRYVYLRERISGCVFRVMTGDPMLMNAFWNFYLAQPERVYD